MKQVYRRQRKKTKISNLDSLKNMTAKQIAEKIFGLGTNKRRLLIAISDETKYGETAIIGYMDQDKFLDFLNKEVESK